jgi:hypothetical protein
MTFAFADTDIATAMETLVAQCDTIHIKILADWSQGAPKSPSVVSRLAAHPSGRITLKYKLDCPIPLTLSASGLAGGITPATGCCITKPC